MTNRLPIVVAGSMVLTALVGCGRNVLPTSPDAGGAGANFVLSGTVIEGQDGGGAVGDASVRLTPGGADPDDPMARTIATDENGAFRAVGLAGGSWTIEVTKRGYRTRSLQIFLDRDVEVTLSLLPMEAGARINGR